MRIAWYTEDYHEEYRTGSRRRGAAPHAAVAAAIAASCAAVNAQDSRAGQTFALGTIEIIGQREPAAVSATTEIIEAAELAARHRDDLSEALDLISGVSVQNLGQRRERLISIRGFSSRQVPLYIDGVPVYVPYDGNVDLARFGVDYVSEVVVSKGLASLLYGPNTLGGAVNVVSRRPTQPLETFARYVVELDDALDGIENRIAASIAGNRDRWYGHLTVSHADSEGYRLPDDFQPVAAEDGGRRESADSADTVVSAKIGLVPNEHDEYVLSYYRQDGEKVDPPYAGSYLRSATRPDGVQVRFWKWPYWDKESLYFMARNAFTGQGTLRWRLFYDSFRNSLESYDDATFTTQTRPYAFRGSRYDDYTYGAGAELEWRWGETQITRVAAHFRQDVHREAQTHPFSPEERLESATFDVAIEHEWRVTDRLSLTPSYSHMTQPGETVQVYDDASQTFVPVSTNRADANNAQLVATYRFDDARSLVAGMSRKTRFPTLKERFSGGLGSAVPNPGLGPETALHYEIGYRRRGGNWSARIALFQSDLNDAIESITIEPTACSSPPCTQQRNVGEQRNRGIELSVDYAPLSTLRLSGQANWLDRDNRSNPDIRPTGTPEHKYLLAADWEFFPRWRLSVDAQHESERFSNSRGTRVASSFTLVNGFVRWTPVQRLGVELGVRNLGDELYAYEEGFYEAGRTWLGQIDYRF